MKLAAALAVLLLAGAAVGQGERPPKAIAEPGSPGSAPSAFRQSPDDLLFWQGLRVIEGVPTKIWLAIGIPVTGNLTITATSGSGLAAPVLNRTGAFVSVAAGAVGLVPFTVTAAEGDRFVNLQAFLDTGGDRVGLAGGTADVVSPVSVAFTSPKLEWIDYGGGNKQALPLHVGHTEAVPFKVLASNHAPSPESITVSLVSDYAGRALATKTIALAAGESKEVLMMDFLFARDLPEFALHLSPGSSMSAPFRLQIGEVLDGRQPLAFNLTDGVVRDARVEYVQVEFHSGVLAKTESVRMVLGQPSWIAVSVTNYGEEKASNIRIDVKETPSPPAYYGPGSYLKETRYVTVEPGEREILNLTFVPRVAGSHVVSVTAFTEGYGWPVQTAVSLPTPLTVSPVGSSILRTGVGDTEKVTFTMNSSENFTNARVGFAISVPSYYGDDIPFVRFITGDDLFEVDASPTGIALAGNGKVWINASFTMLSAGTYHVVPYVAVGDLVYTGGGLVGGGGGPFFEGRASAPAVGPGVGIPGPSTGGGYYEVQVVAGAISIPQLWMPLVLVFVGFGGYWIYRWKYVR